MKDKAHDRIILILRTHETHFLPFILSSVHSFTFAIDL